MPERTKRFGSQDVGQDALTKRGGCAALFEVSGDGDTLVRRAARTPSKKNEIRGARSFTAVNAQAKWRETPRDPAPQRLCEKMLPTEIPRAEATAGATPVGDAPAENVHCVGAGRRFRRNAVAERVQNREFQTSLGCPIEQARSMQSVCGIGNQLRPLLCHHGKRRNCFLPRLAFHSVRVPVTCDLMAASRLLTAQRHPQKN